MSDQGELFSIRMLCRIEAANYVRFTWGMPLSPNTLAKLAVIGGGPIFRKVGKFPLYEAVNLDRWVLARLGQKRRSTSDVPNPTSPYTDPDPLKEKTMIEDMKLPERPPTPPSMDNIFADIEKLRITVDPQFSGAKEILNHIPVHKPGMAEFVRVNPEPAMPFATVIYVDTDNQRQHYIVAPHKYAELAGETKMVTLMLAMSRQGVLFFWPLIFPNDAHSPNARIETAREGAEIAKRAWIRLKSDMTLGGYRIMRAEGEIDEPNWPVKPINELLELAFKGRVIQINLQDKFDMDQ